MASNDRVVSSLRRVVLILMVGALGAVGCGGGDETGGGATSDAPSPVDDSQNAATATDETDEGGAATDEADEGGAATDEADEGGAAVELSKVRWYTSEDQFGNILMRFFALVENTSDLVQEVRVEVEAVDADGAVIGRSGPQPFLDTILPGEQLAIGLGGRVSGEPADVVPIVRPDALSEHQQDRYEIMTLEGEVLDFTVGEEEITVVVEVANTGSEPSLTGIYTAVFDTAGEIVAVGLDYVTQVPPGETERHTLSLSRDPRVDVSVDRVELYFPAQPSRDIGG